MCRNDLKPYFKPILIDMLKRLQLTKTDKFVYYFAYFLVILPLLGAKERTLPLPASISMPVLRGGGGPLPAGAMSKPMEKA